MANRYRLLRIVFQFASDVNPPSPEDPPIPRSPEANLSHDPIPTPPKQQCEGISKKTGERCQAFAVHGERLCAGHGGKGFGADPAAAAKKSAQIRSGQAEARRRGPRDVYAQALVDNAEALVARLLAIALKGEDDGAALRAIEQLTSRVLGKPKETVETHERPDELKKIAEMTPQERDALWRELMAKGVTLDA